MAGRAVRWQWSIGDPLATRHDQPAARALRLASDLPWRRLRRRIGDCTIVIGDVTGPAAEFGPVPSSIYLYVPDCDVVYQQAIAAGGPSVKEVQDIPFNGECYGGVRDPVGNIWCIATHVRDVSMEEMTQRLGR